MLIVVLALLLFLAVCAKIVFVVRDTKRVVRECHAILDEIEKEQSKMRKKSGW